MKTKKRLEILMTILVVLILLVASYQYFLNKKEVKLKETEKSNMLSSCYKGCQFSTQEIYGIVPINDSLTRIKLYNDCAILCAKKYFR